MRENSTEAQLKNILLNNIMLSTSKKDLSNMLIQLGLEKRDIVMVHTFLPSLGRLEGNIDGFYEVLSDVIGNDGTMIVPTFTYSYCKKEVFDVQNTASTVGVFTEYIRKKNEAIRSLDGIFSMAAIGPHAKDLMQRDKKNSMGIGSIYDKIHSANTRFLLIGIGWSEGLAFSMHVEKLANVYYRYDKTFKGITRDRGRTFEDEVIYYVRDLKLDPIGDRDRVGIKMEQNGLAKTMKLGYGVHRLISANDYCTFTLKELEKDPLAIVRIKGENA